MLFAGLNNCPGHKHTCIALVRNARRMLTMWWQEGSSFVYYLQWGQWSQGGSAFERPCLSHFEIGSVWQDRLLGNKAHLFHFNRGFFLKHYVCMFLKQPLAKGILSPFQWSSSAPGATTSQMPGRRSRSYVVGKAQDASWHHYHCSFPAPRCVQWSNRSPIQISNSSITVVWNNSANYVI